MDLSPPTKSGPRANHDIKSLTVRLIDEEGEQQGVVSTADALQRAYEVGLDLVEVSPQCRSAGLQNP